MSEKTPQYLDVVSNAFKTASAWRSAFYITGAIAVALAFALVSAAKNTPVILVPQNFAMESGNMKVTTNGEIKGTNSQYLADVALGDLAMILDFTPDTVVTQYQRFMNRLTSSLYGSEKDTLLGQADELKKKGITQSFFPSDVRVTPDGKMVYVKGTQIRYVAGKEMQRAEVRYRVTYTFYKGYLHITDLRQESN
jgi:hypothetical protein